MTYTETLDYLYSRLPMFTRVGSSAIKKDLTNTRLLCERLNNPQGRFKSIHVAGTNGKGSVSHMLAAVLQSAGYKTGLYTSPHLRDFRERIRINGEMIPEKAVIDFVKDQRESIEHIEPSFFEVTVAMAFDHFAKNEVDVAVIETGLGGRLDSTNIITPILSVITNISFDHMNILGNTLPEIAREKAGIIKQGRPVIISQKQEDIKDVFIGKADENAAPLVFASDQWEILPMKPEYNNPASISDLREVKVSPLDPGIEPFVVQLDLTGTYQINNLKGVLSAVEWLKTLGFSISRSALLEGLSGVKKHTGLMGRWHILDRQPLVICDTAHNEDGIREVLINIRQTPFNTLRMVIGMVNDKDISKVLSILPRNATYYFCQPDLERAKPVAELARQAAEHGLAGRAFDSVTEALNRARAEAHSDDLIFVGGSTFVVAEII